MQNREMIVKARWWLCLPVALICLMLLDAGLRLWWHPHPDRLPDQFSTAYLQRYVRDLRGERPVIVLGDSVLWGYKLPAADATPTLLALALKPAPVANLSYEGGSDANSYFVLRYVLSQGVRPRAVLFGINSKETSPGDSAYNRLQPSVERAVLPLMSAADRSRLVLSSTHGIPEDLEADVASVWYFYRYRTDIREQLFGTDDASLAFRHAVQHATGSAALQAAAHRPTPDKFLGTYDLEQADPNNVDVTYLRELVALLKQNDIPSVAFLTPTNHALLHEYIDDPAYDAKLRFLANIARATGVRVLNLDRSIRVDEFIDNDHLTREGNERLTTLLLPAIKRVIK